MRESMNKREKDRVKGALLGLAVGDALGTTLEFKSPGSFEPIQDMIGGGPFDLKPGQWTDDTSMAICLAQSLIERKGMCLEDQIKRYLEWWLHGRNSVTGSCFDIGNTVRNALISFSKFHISEAGSKHPRTAGNGSIMRLAPVALSYHKWEVEELLYRCEQSSRTTHQAEECLAACRVLGLLIAKALRATSKSEVCQMTPQELETLDIHERAPRVYAIAQGSFTRCSDDEIRGSGYVVESLQAALWAFYHSTSFREGALKAVNLGDDADTTGAVYGQIAGAFYGAEGIPDVWLQKLAWRDQLESYALQLAV